MKTNDSTTTDLGNDAKRVLATRLLSETKCTAANCDKPAIGDYNGHGDYACEYHMRKWNAEFDDDYS